MKIILSFFFIISSSIVLFAQCPTCTYVAPAGGSNYTLNGNEILCINGNASGLNITSNNAGNSVCIDAGSTLDLGSNAFSNIEFDVYGTLNINSSSVNWHGPVVMNVHSSGVLNVDINNINSNNLLTINNDGCMNLNSTSNVNFNSITLVNGVDAKIDATSTNRVNFLLGSVCNAGLMEYNGLENNDTDQFYNKAGGEIYVANDFDNSGDFSNEGYLSVGGAITVGNKGVGKQFENSSCICITGDLRFIGPAVNNGTLRILNGDLIIEQSLTGNNGSIILNNGVSTIATGGYYAGTNSTFCDVNTPGNNFDNISGNSIPLNTYTVDCTNSSTACGCGGPFVYCSATFTSPACQNSNIELMESGIDGVAWSWSGPNGFTSSLQNPTVNPAVAGTYFVTVTDDVGATSVCSTAVTVTLSPGCTALAVTQPACGMSNGSASANAFGGTGPYTYLWPNAQTTQVATNLAAGMHTVTVTDASGCTSTCTVSLTDLPSPTCSTSSSSQPNCGMNNGSASVFPSGGSGPFTYLWDNGETMATVTNLPEGTHNVTVTDSNGCTGSCSITLTDTTDPTCSAMQTLAPSCGMSTGNASATPTGGSFPFTYLWDDGQTTAVATNLSEGMYTVTVTDANGCTSSCTATLVDSNNLTCAASQTTAPICAMNNGSATVTPLNGTMPYSYAWSDGQTTAVAINLSAGMYTVTVTDVNGCSSSCTTTLTDILGPTCTAAETTAPTCAMANGSATVTPMSGTLPYSYAWDDGQTTPVAINLPAGMYTVTVTDANGCTSSCTTTLTDISGPTCAAAQTVAPTCAMANGSATVTPMNGTAPYTFAWSDGQTTAVANNYFRSNLHRCRNNSSNMCDVKWVSNGNTNGWNCTLYLCME